MYLLFVLFLLNMKDNEPIYSGAYPTLEACVIGKQHYTNVNKDKLNTQQAQDNGATFVCLKVMGDV